jgi:hypothetical protein
MQVVPRYAPGAILTAARKHLPARVLATLEQLPTPRRIVSMSRDKIELLLKGVDWDGMIAAGKLPTSFPSAQDIMSGGVGANSPGSTLASLLSPGKLTEIVRAALGSVPGGAAHVKSLEDGVNKAKAAVAAAANKAAESSPALALIKRTAEGLLSLKSKVEEATREAKKGLLDAAAAAKKASVLQREAVEAKMRSLVPGVTGVDRANAAARVEELMKEAASLRQSAVDAVGRHTRAFHDVSEALQAEAEGILGGGGTLERAGGAIPESLKQQASALVSAAEGFKQRAGEAAARVAAVTSDADAAKSAMKQIESVAKRYAALADLSDILTKVGLYK